VTDDPHFGKGERHRSDTPLIADSNGVHLCVGGFLKNVLSNGSMDFKHGGVTSDGYVRQLGKVDAVGTDVRLDVEGRRR
jgi:hypothetical protein